MRLIIVVLGLLASTAVCANGLAEVAGTERCVSWARNAMYGATQSMRGASRQVEFVTRASLLEMLTQSSGLGRDKLYILVEDNDSEDERGFLEQSTLFGYDAMSSWKMHNTGYGPTRDEWRQHFMTTCLESAVI